jgi:magnesium transporter
VVGLFQETIDRLLILTMFLPVLAGQSGNTGSQALAITLRACSWASSNWASKKRWS